MKTNDKTKGGMGILLLTMACFLQGAPPKKEEKNKEKDAFEKRIPLEDMFLYADLCARRVNQKNKACSLVIGPTRAGKSTIITDLLGGEWRVEKKKGKKEELVFADGTVDFITKQVTSLSLKNPQMLDEIPKKGDEKLTSCTLIPRVFSGKKSPLFYCDTPGFFDTRDENSARFATAFPLFFAHRLRKGIASILVVSTAESLSQNSAAKNARELFAQIGTFFGKVAAEKHPSMGKHIHLIINQCNGDQFKQARYNLTQIAKTIIKEVMEGGQKEEQKEKSTGDDLYQKKIAALNFFSLLGKIYPKTQDYQLNIKQVHHYTPDNKGKFRAHMDGLHTFATAMAPNMWQEMTTNHPIWGVIEKMEIRLSGHLKQYEDICQEEEMIAQLLAIDGKNLSNSEKESLKKATILEFSQKKTKEIAAQRALIADLKGDKSLVAVFSGKHRIANVTGWERGALNLIAHTLLSPVLFSKKFRKDVYEYIDYEGSEAVVAIELLGDGAFYLYNSGPKLFYESLYGDKPDASFQKYGKEISANKTIWLKPEAIDSLKNFEDYLEKVKAFEVLRKKYPYKKNFLMNKVFLTEKECEENEKKDQQVEAFAKMPAHTTYKSITNGVWLNFYPKEERMITLQATMYTQKNMYTSTRLKITLEEKRLQELIARTSKDKMERLRAHVAQKEKEEVAQKVKKIVDLLKETAMEKYKKMLSRGLYLTRLDYGMGKWIMLNFWSRQIDGGKEKSAQKKAIESTLKEWKSFLERVFKEDIAQKGGFENFAKEWVPKAEKEIEAVEKKEDAMDEEAKAPCALFIPKKEVKKQGAQPMDDAKIEAPQKTLQAWFQGHKLKKLYAPFNELLEVENDLEAFLACEWSDIEADGSDIFKDMKKTLKKRFQRAFKGAKAKRNPKHGDPMDPLALD